MVENNVNLWRQIYENILKHKSCKFCLYSVNIWKAPHGMKALITSTSQLKSGISYFVSSSTTLTSIKYFNYILPLTNIKDTKINERKFGKYDRIIRRITIGNTTFYNNISIKQCVIKRHTNQNFTRITKLKNWMK